MAVDVTEIRRMIREPAKVPDTFDSYYDKEADVLYITFVDALEDDSDLTPDDIVLRYKDGQLLSVTILHASKRAGLHLDA
jgi:uncharacterized protein YuzE